MNNRDEKKITVIPAETVMELIKNHIAAVKSFRSKMDEKQVECQEWMFFINQYIDPENNRPLKNPKQKMLSTEFYDPSTGEIKSRISRERGLPKKGTINIKKTPISLLPTNGRMQTFYMDDKFYTTGLIYNIDLCLISPKWIFNENMRTNDRWHIPGQPGYTDAVTNPDNHQSTTLENIRNTQNQLMKEKKLIHWNEINAKTNRNSISAIFTIQPYQKHLYITDRINAIHKKYLILTHLFRDLPIFCINSAEEASEYTVLQQATDIFDGLKRYNHKPTDTTYTGYVITKSLPFHLILTPDSKLGTELVNLIRSNEQCIKDIPQCAIFYYLMKKEITNAMSFMPTKEGELFELTKKWINTYLDYIIKSVTLEEIIPFILDDSKKADSQCNKTTHDIMKFALNNNFTDDAFHLINRFKDFNKDSLKNIMCDLPLTFKNSQLFFFKLFEKILSLNYHPSESDLLHVYVLNDDKIMNRIIPYFQCIFIEDDITSLCQKYNISELHYVSWLILNFPSKICNSNFLLEKALECYTTPSETKSTDVIIKQVVQDKYILLPPSFLKLMLEKKDTESLQYLTEESSLEKRIDKTSLYKDYIKEEDKAFNSLLYYLDNKKFTLVEQFTSHFKLDLPAKQRFIKHLSKFLNEDFLNKDFSKKNPILQKIINNIMCNLLGFINPVPIFELSEETVYIIIWLVRYCYPHMRVSPQYFKKLVFDCIHKKHQCILSLLLYNQPISSENYGYFIEFIKTQIKEHSEENNLIPLINQLIFGKTPLQLKDQIDILELLIEKNIDDSSLYQHFMDTFSKKHPKNQAYFIPKIVKYRHVDELKLSYDDISVHPQAVVGYLYYLELTEYVRTQSIQLFLKNISTEYLKYQFIFIFLEKAARNKDFYLILLLLEQSLTLKDSRSLPLQSYILTCANEPKLAPKILDFLSLAQKKDEKERHIHKIASDFISSSIQQTNSLFAVMNIIKKIDTSEEFKFIKNPSKYSIGKDPSWKNTPISNTWKTILELAKNKLLELAKKDPTNPSEDLLKDIQDFLKTPIKSFKLGIFSHDAPAQADHLAAAFLQALKEKSVNEKRKSIYIQWN